MSNISRITLLVVLMVTSLARADSFVPEFATTVELPEHDDHQWFWLYGFRAPNQSDSRAFLMDEAGHQLGQLNMGFWGQTVINAQTRGEIITLETYMSRGTRGERTDLVVIYDERTLAPIREIAIPPKRINAVRAGVTAVLSEDERFLLITNYTPAQSVTVVDLDKGSMVQEVETPGCSVLYPAGPRDYYAICGNGGFLQLKLDETGKVVARKRTDQLFDAVNDFLTVSASRIGDTWYFVSRENNIYGITMAGDKVSLAGKWPIATKSEADDGWMIAGFGHTAAHEQSGKLYVLVQQGEPENFEGPGSAVWVFDTATMEKVSEIEMAEYTVSIAVSPGDKPRLYALDIHIPLNLLATLWMALTEGEASLEELARQRANVFDADTGEHLLSSDLVPAGYIAGVKSW